MGKNNKQLMYLNKETAMRLWNKSFGKEIKVKDFAGRIIAKGAYNDRNSEFGWNVDHILPQSKGGSTADYNLVCCHMLTNDEKANKFPCFNANNIAFEIIKVQNHYEIRAKSKTHKSNGNDEGIVDFFDSASGIAFFTKLKGIQNKKRFVGSILVRLCKVSNNAVIDFIEELFELENISFTSKTYPFNNEVHVIIRNFNMSLKADSNILLDKCVLLNTYLSSYFLECGYIDNFDIHYRIDYYDNKSQMYSANTDFKCDYTIRHSMFVNNLVLENTDAGEKVTKDMYHEYSEYNFVFTNLEKNLKKEANGK